MITQLNPAYRKYWKQCAKYKASTYTYAMFLDRLASDHVYKRRVNDYLDSFKSQQQLQRELEGTVNYAYN